jgi:hypothetical protein
MWGRIALLGVAVMAAGGCVSAPALDSASSGAAARSAAANQRCAVFAEPQLRRIVGQQFQGPVTTADSSDEIAECQWTAADQAALVIVRVSDGNGGFLFRETASATQRNIGRVVDLDVPGAQRAFGVPSLGRVGMVVDGDYVEVSTLVPGATDAVVKRLAGLAARQAGG